MIVAPSAVGKSTLMNQVAELDSDFTRIGGFTSRPQRANDEPGLYEYIPHTDEGIRSILAQKEAGQLVQYVIHPTTGFIYGSRLHNYPGTYNMKDTLSNVVASLSKLPFHNSHVVGLVTDPQIWHEWFLKRNQHTGDNYQKRVTEAITSLEWLSSQPEASISWVYNHPDDIATDSKELVALIKGEKKSDPLLRDYAVKMLSLANQMKE